VRVRGWERNSQFWAFHTGSCASGPGQRGVYELGILCPAAQLEGEWKRRMSPFKRLLITMICWPLMWRYGYSLCA
jgi:hypothetical protein